MAMNIRWLCWILIGVLSLACFGPVAAQAPEGLDVNQPGLKLGADRADVRAMVYRLCAAVGIVLVLAGVAIYLIRVVMPKLGPARKKRVKVAEVHYLGGRKMVHLIEVGHRQLLVGSTPTHISMLADVTQHWDEAEELALSAEVGDKS
jgi:flagellar biogenesis protein FliO